MTKELDLKPYYSMEPRSALYVLRYNWADPVMMANGDGTSSVARYDWKSHHVKNLSKNYKSAVDKAIAYDKDVKICEMSDLRDYDTSSTGERARLQEVADKFAQDYPHYVELADELSAAVDRNYDLEDLHFPVDIQDGRDPYVCFKMLQTPDAVEYWTNKAKVETFSKKVGPFTFRNFVYQILDNKQPDLTEGQYEFMHNLYNQYVEKVDAKIEWAMDLVKDSIKLNDVPVTSDRIEITGEIQSVKDVLTDFGVAYKCVIITDQKFKLYGSVPSKLMEAVEYDETQLVGKSVKFSAKIQRSDSDPKFGFYSRPTKPELH